MVNSSVGCKSVMAVTGLLLFGFVVAHLAGNLQIFLGPDALNSYAHKLETLGPVLWGMRIGLLAIFVVHIGSAIFLTRGNWAARPVPYHFEDTVQATIASRTMLMTGLLILAFVLYHLAHFTFQAVSVPKPAPPSRSARAAAAKDKDKPQARRGFYEIGPDGKERRDVYSLVVLSFRNWLVTATYIVAQIFLYMHLSHGIASMFQTLGANNEKWRPLTQKIAAALAFLIFVGNCAIPFACWVGLWVKLPGEL